MDKDYKIPENVKGYPRPVGTLNGHNMPMPWVSGDLTNPTDWAAVDHKRAIEADDDKLCMVCGNPLSPDFVYMLLHNTTWAAHTPRNEMDMLFSGAPSVTYAHPKCGRIASKFCPHLKRAEYPAMTQDGDRLTHQELDDKAQKSDTPPKR